MVRVIRSVWEERQAVPHRAGQNVVLIRCVADAIDLIAVLVKSGNLRDGSVVQVQCVSIGCDEHAEGKRTGTCLTCP